MVGKIGVLLPETKIVGEIQNKKSKLLAAAVTNLNVQKVLKIMFLPPEEVAVRMLSQSALLENLMMMK
jgi:hypothetical protein